MKFKDLAQAFDQLEQEASRNKKTDILADVLKKATVTEASTIAYLSLGSLNPTYEKAQFNFAEKSMLKVIAYLVGKKIEDVKISVSQLGDLGLVLAQGYAEQSLDDHLTISQVHNRLDRFLQIVGTGSQDVKEQLLVELLKDLDPVSGKYVIRIILGKLRLGFSDMTLLDAFSVMAVQDKSLRKQLESGYNVSADIGLIAKILKEEGIAGIEKINITPGIPIRPSAAERLADAKAIFEKLGQCIAQPKLDGFRLQLHLDKTKEKPAVHFFSRNLQDMSGMFPDLYSAVVELDVKTCVIEGEAIAYDVETGSFLPFQETVKRRRKYDIEKVSQDFPLKLYFFDLLYLDGESFLDQSHVERRKELLKILGSKKIEKRKIIYPIEEKQINESKDLEVYFENSISVGLEGVVVKRGDAPYIPGKRNFNWIKLKRQETGSLSDTIDCVILGYYFGHGKRARFGIGALLIGVYNVEKQCFQTIAKIGTGLKDEEWREQKRSCDEIAISSKPSDVDCAKELYPDVWVEPKLVCMVRADEITKSPLHAAGKKQDQLGLALRFPRIMGYRPDKSANDATTVGEVEQLFKLQFNKNKKN